MMTDDYAGYNVALHPGVQRLACMDHARRKFIEVQKDQPKDKTGRADISLNMIKKPYSIECDLKEASDEGSLRSSRLSSDARHGCSASRPMGRPPVRRPIVWSKPPSSTARSLKRGCATYWRGYL